MLAKNHTTTWAASLAFYMALSLAPLLVLFLALSSTLSVDLQEVFIQQAQKFLGSIVADGLSTVIQSAQIRPDLASISGFVGTCTLLFSAGLIFTHTREALNEIFARSSNVQDEENLLSSVWELLKSIFVRVGFVVFFLLAMIASLMVTAFLSATIDTQDDVSLAFLNIILSFILYVFIFSVLFHYLPNGKIPWSQTLQAAAITSVLFQFGKEVVGFYLGQSVLSSSYGAAGSIIAFLVWVYYSALIIFFGANVSQVLQNHLQRHLKKSA